jgi:hypothetical protein
MKGESRPRGPAPETPTTTPVSTIASVGQDLRRRRAAADRMERLDDGRRDPLDGVRYRRRRRRPDLAILIVTEWTAEVRGHEVWRVIDKLGCKRQFGYQPISGFEPCWMVPANTVPDMCAMAERLGGRATVEEAVLF